MKTLSIITICIFLSCVDLEAAEYQSIVDLYPTQAEAAGVLRLGEIEEIEGSLLRTVGECKSVNTDSWFQFYDVAVNGEFDNKADFAIFLILRENKFEVVWLYHDITQAIEIITEHCEENNVETQGFIHFADPIKVRKGNEI